MTSDRPDVIQLGPAVRLVSVRQIAREVGLPMDETHAWLVRIGVTVEPVGDMVFVSLHDLEWRAWRWWGGPDDLDLLRRAGDCYNDMDMRAIRARLRRAWSRPKLKPASPVKLRRSKLPCNR